MPDESSRVVTLRSGEVDVIDSITPDSADQLAGLSGVAIDRVDGVRLNQLFSTSASRRITRWPTRGCAGADLCDRRPGAGRQRPAGLRHRVARGYSAHAWTVRSRPASTRYDPARHVELDALGVRDLELKIIWETGEFAADTDIMESVLQMLGGRRASHPAAVRTGR